MHVVNTFQTSNGMLKFCIKLEADWLIGLDEAGRKSPGWSVQIKNGMTHRRSGKHQTCFWYNFTNAPQFRSSFLYQLIHDMGHKCHCGFGQLIMYSFRSFNNLICMIFKFTR